MSFTVNTLLDYKECSLSHNSGSCSKTPIKSRISSKCSLNLFAFSPLGSTIKQKASFVKYRRRLSLYGGVKRRHKVASASFQNFLLFLIMPLPYCVYILFSHKDFRLYIGYTTNISARVKNHNSGGTTSTANRIPLELIFCEFYVFEEDARKRELYFKTTMGKKAIKLMLTGTLNKLGYKGTLKPLDIVKDDIVD